MIPYALTQGSKAVRISVGMWALFLSTAFCNAAQFSADVYLNGVPRSGVRSYKAFQKLYVKGNRERLESYLVDARTGNPKPGSKPDGVDLILGDKKIVVQMKPSRREYCVTPLGTGVATANTRPSHHGGTKTEVVSGYPCDKYRSSYTIGRERVATTCWWSPRLDYVLKTVTVGPTGTLVSEVRHIQEKRIADSAFDIPPGYKERARCGTRATGGRRRSHGPRPATP